MSSSGKYGQYCPLAMSAELLCNRWTLLVIRELLDGSTGFNEIIRGLPLMSRTLLSNRLKELEAAGVIRRASAQGGKRTDYRLTAAGNALGSVVRTMAEWGQEWIDVEPSVKNVVVEFLMWDVRRNVKPIPQLPSRFVVQFYFPDAPKDKQSHWLVFDTGNVDLCYIDPGFDVDVYIEADLVSFTKVWMGWDQLASAISSGKIAIEGPSKITNLAPNWLGLSGLAGIKKRPASERVLRT